MPEGDTTNSS